MAVAAKEAVPKAEAEAQNAARKVCWIADERVKNAGKAKKFADAAQEEAVNAEAVYRQVGTDEQKKKYEAAKKKYEGARHSADDAQKLYEDAAEKAADVAAPC
jgi:hypothetical protein